MNSIGCIKISCDWNGWDFCCKLVILLKKKPLKITAYKKLLEQFCDFISINDDLKLVSWNVLGTKIGSFYFFMSLSSYVLYTFILCFIYIIQYMVTIITVHSMYFGWIMFFDGKKIEWNLYAITDKHLLHTILWPYFGDI